MLTDNFDIFIEKINIQIDLTYLFLISKVSIYE